MPEHPVFAAIYDRALKGAERAGLAEMRHSLLADAQGRTLELGAGTGLNLVHYPAAVSELVLVEPDPHMAKRLRGRITAAPPSVPVEVIAAPAEDLPFDDGSFDTVVSTLVLCTVEDPDRAVAEARRVLAPGGLFLFLEHVRSPRPGLARLQDLLERPWGWVAGGCHPNRSTEQAIAGGGFWVERLERDRLPGGMPVVRPAVRGLARRPGSG